VLRSSRDGAVVVVVSEVPRLGRSNASVAAPAADCACGDLGLPLGALPVVLGVVAALLSGAALLVTLAFVVGTAGAGRELRTSGFDAWPLEHQL
jgi:hypothetical protein